MPSNYNHFCPYCLVSTKQNLKCGNCGQLTIAISKQARVPKKGAKKRNKLVYVANRNAVADGPAPHHSTECGGRNGYVTTIDLNTSQLTGKR